ncbi:MAG: helix-turn-helix transcriptional regulator [Lachnospiraceae bacterium]|nr:helix-turn-helix transcriptional regulator [Lachnospiraceae bacterium]
MSVRSAGKTIREARIKAGLSQEKLSDGICSLQSLSRIENESAGVSPSTFQALMARAGAPCEVFPVFENWKDFDCFFHLKHARFHLNSWQLDTAYEELNQLEAKEWNQNRFYYQEWLLLHSMLQFRSGQCSHAQNYDTLLTALHISRPTIDLSDFRHLLLSINEIELLIYAAQELLYLNHPDECLSICSQLQTYLSNTEIAFLEKDHLLAELAVVYCKYLIANKEYSAANQLADTHRHQMVLNGDDTSLLELTFLTGVSSYYLGDPEAALLHFKDVFYSAHAIHSPFATISRNYACTNLNLELPSNLLEVPDIPLCYFETKKITDISAFTDGVYDYNASTIITIGSLIQKFRLDNNVSQQMLCQGLCSKSKLSKIENGTLQPDVALAEALLQRLGFSEREFVFWGDAKEAKFHELKFRLMHDIYLSADDKAAYIAQLKKLITPKDTLYYQFYLLETTTLPNFCDDVIEVLQQALSCTLPQFDINQISSYRLSWTELSILNNIAHAYRLRNNSLPGITYYKQLLEYQRIVTPDIMLQSRTYAVTLRMLVRSFYLQEHHKELVDTLMNLDLTVLNYNLSNCGGFYFYYIQSLCECKKYANVALFTKYSYATYSLMELSQNSYALIQGMSDEYNIQIEY